MVFDEEKLEQLRGKGADFKESYDMGKSPGVKRKEVRAE